jgi:molybdenum cofactor biosynthesis enzyme MoaA
MLDFTKNNLITKISSINAASHCLIHLYIIDVCNYECSYCYNEMPRTNKSLDLNLVLKFIKNVHEEYTI